MGAPGILTGAGSTIRTNVISGTTQIPDVSRLRVYKDEYTGYAVTSGKFNGLTNWYAAGGPRALDLLGQVVIFQYVGTNSLEVLFTIKGNKFGSYFGGSLATGRLTGGLDLLVGAQTYPEDKYDEGKVFVYEYKMVCILLANSLFFLFFCFIYFFLFFIISIFFVSIPSI